MHSYQPIRNRSNVINEPATNITNRSPFARDNTLGHPILVRLLSLATLRLLQFAERIATQKWKPNLYKRLFVFLMLLSEVSAVSPDYCKRVLPCNVYYASDEIHYIQSGCKLCSAIPLSCLFKIGATYFMVSGLHNSPVPYTSQGIDAIFNFLSHVNIYFSDSRQGQTWPTRSGWIPWHEKSKLCYLTVVLT